jgi:hypothetical protein
MLWIAISDEMPPEWWKDNLGPVVLANRSGVMGVFSNVKTDGPNGDLDWWIDDDYYDGDDPPTHWIRLPPIPKKRSR